MLRTLGLIVSLIVMALSPVVAQDPPPLTAPTDLSASVSAEGIAVTWTAPDGQVDGYEILRRRPLQGETDLTTLVDNTGDSETSYTDTSATTPGEQYVYGVKSIRGSDRSDASESVQVDYITVSCEIVAGDNHDILQCAADAGEIAITSALWTPSFEDQYEQNTSRASAAWVIADEFCGQSTTVTVTAQSGETEFPTVETSITLECRPDPVDTLTVSCENQVVNNQQVLSCSLSGGDQTITSAQWSPQYDAQGGQTTEDDDATEASWVVSAENCGQTTSMEVIPSAGETTLSTVSTTFSLPCLIIVDDDCSLANAIRSANGIAQVEESDDSDGNDDCEAGGAPDESASPPDTGDDIILLKKNVTLTGPLPSITSRVQLEGKGYTVSGDAAHRVFMVVDGQLSVNDLTITKGLASTVGGGIYLNSGSLSVKDSAIKDSKANDIGGAIYAIDSDVEIVDSEFSGNMTVKSHGGSVYFISSTGLHSLDIEGVTFKKNMATEDGGALKTAGGIVTINKSTFVENQGDEGGAIESSETSLDITNSTFSENSAREGGGISSFSSFVTLTHTTWAHNSAVEQGGAIAIIGWTGNFKIRNTLITNSKSGGDCHSGPNPNIIIQFTGNFIQDGSCVPQTAESQAAAAESESAEFQAQAVEVAEAQEVLVAEAQSSEDLVDAGISSLSGDPQHHPLLSGSPAIDAADPMYCLLDDQPFTARPQYGNCDIGAYEYPKTPRLSDPPDPPEPDPPDPPDPPEPEDTPAPPPPAATPTASPVPPTPTPAPDCIHIVSEGENLFRIAILYNMTVREISSFNNLLRDDQLSVGQELTIPFDHCESPAIRKG
ncbi:MAG: LysM peptidoglycan-binding domain-containing protein [Chloroflexi bacterium]|nr:LysM peptidoglycan-binding domain-containing protein [Chloroflexota bacterium]